MIRTLVWKLRTWLTGARMERDLREELDFHRDMLVRDGRSPDDARLRIGNVTAVQERSRDEWGFPSLESVLKDARYAVRSLLRSPSYTLAAALTLALGIGAVVTIFTIVDAVMLRPLPYRDGAALMSVYSTGRQQPGRVPLSFPDFRDLAGRQTVFSSVAFARGDGLRVRGDMGAEALGVAFVSDGMFQLFGTAPLLGRTLAPDDGQSGAPPTLVLGHRVWMERFGGDPAIVNRTISTVSGPYTVVGVMPAAFAWPEWAEGWTSLRNAPVQAAEMERRAYRVDARTIGRLAPGVTQEQADAALELLGDQLAAEYPNENAELTMRAVSLRSEIIGPVQRPLAVLLGAVIGLLLIACANVSNLSLARASTRMREIGVRLAIGASRARVVRQLLVESLVLSAVGSALGMAVGAIGVQALLRIAPADLPRLAEVGIDARVLLFTAIVASLAALVFGLAPALSVSSSDVSRAVREGGRGAGGGRGAVRVQSFFIVAEVAVAVALVIGSGLLMKSFANMRNADPGFEVERLVSLRLEPLPEKYPAPQQKLLLYNRIRDEVSRLPGVERVSYINHSPATRSGVVTPLESDGEPRPDGQPPRAWYRLVDSGYFETMRQRVVRGRPFAPAEIEAGALLAVVNESLARAVWGSQDPIGRRIVAFKQSSGVDAGARIEARVIGVVADIKDYDATFPANPELFLPFSLNPWRSTFLAVRTTTDPQAVIPQIRRVVTAIDPDLPVRRTLAVDRMMLERLARRSFNAALMTAFGVVALLLASFGIYGIVAYSVAQRTQEIGVRSALGASAGQLVRVFVRRATMLALTGAVIGVGLALLVGQALEGMLFGVRATDAVTFLQVSGIVLVVAAAAAWLPARRALRVDPVIAMRAD